MWEQFWEFDIYTRQSLILYIITLYEKQPKAGINLEGLQHAD